VATVVVLGARESRTRRLVVELAERRGHTVRSGPPRPEPKALLRGADAIVLVPAGARGAREVTRAVRAAAPSRAHLLLVSSFAVGHGPRHELGRVTGALPELRGAERAVRAGSAPYTIVRPTWLTDDPAGAHAITLTQDPHADGMLARPDLAATLVAAVEQPSARGRTMALFNEPGDPPDDWAARFATLVADREARGA
jgi:uncharacterized protein YbjT (DUF2867 family)